MAAFGVDGVDGRADRRSSCPPVATAARRTPSSPTPRRPATRWRWPPSPVDGCTVPGLAQRLVAGRRRGRRPARPDGVRRHRRPDGIAVARDPTVPLRGVDVDMADVSDLVPTLAAVAAHGGVADDDHAASASSGPRRATASATSPPSCAKLGAARRRCSTTGCASSRRPSCTAPASAPTTTTAWRWRSACSATAVDGIAVDDPGVVAKSWPGFWDVRDEIIGRRVRTERRRRRDDARLMAGRRSA